MGNTYTVEENPQLPPDLPSHPAVHPGTRLQPQVDDNGLQQLGKSNKLNEIEAKTNTFELNG
jgi:hypothetical protein